MNYGSYEVSKLEEQLLNTLNINKNVPQVTMQQPAQPNHSSPPLVGSSNPFLADKRGGVNNMQQQQQHAVFDEEEIPSNPFLQSTNPFLSSSFGMKTAKPYLVQQQQQQHVNNAPSSVQGVGGNLPFIQPMRSDEPLIMNNMNNNRVAAPLAYSQQQAQRSNEQQHFPTQYPDSATTRPREMYHHQQPVIMTSPPPRYEEAPQQQQWGKNPAMEMESSSATQHQQQQAVATSPLRTPMKPRVTEEMSSESKPHSKAAPFDWKSVGIITVKPAIVAPDQNIEITWEIPLQYVNTASLDKRSSRSEDSDFIALFRSRQRIDVVEGSILTREISGRATIDRKRGLLVGGVRIRAPRGVGTYDIRYFTKKNEEEEEVVVEEREAEPSNKLPLCKSNLFSVEVQGSSLFEAIQFCEKNLKDKKRMIGVIQQIGTLISQIRTLRKPLDVPAYKNEANQERKLIGDLWRVVETAIVIGMQMQDSFLEQLDGLEEKLKMNKMENEFLLLNDEEDEEQQQQDNNEESNNNNIAAAAATVNNKNQTSVSNLRREISRCKRDVGNLASSVKGLIDDIQANSFYSTLLGEEHSAFLNMIRNRYLNLEERFFSTVEEMTVFVSTHHRLSVFSNNSMLNMDPERGMEMEARIANRVSELIPTNEFYLARRDIINRVQQALNANGIVGNVVPFGSSANSFGAWQSDLDLCFVRKPNGGEMMSSIELIESIAGALKLSGFLNVDDVRKTARIPIVEFKDSIHGVDCDICINNPLAIRNTLLLRTYGSIDERVVKIAFVVKEWAKKRKINNPAKHTLSSYAWILLVVNFLQRIKMLPNLQELGPFQATPITGADGKVHETYFYCDPQQVDPSSPSSALELQAALQNLQAFAKKNQNPACVLLAGFFFDLAYKTDWRNQICSIRTGGLFLKSIKCAEDQWRSHARLSIEDPFETSYDVAHILRDSTFRLIRLEAVRAYALLMGVHEDYVSASVEQCLNGLFEERNEDGLILTEDTD